MSPVARYGAPRADRPSAPAPARTEDGNDWTWGACWGWCERPWLRVLWVGSATIPGGQVADLYYCGSCVRRMYRRVQSHARPHTHLRVLDCGQEEAGT
ncbi:hypothetical protein GCM10009654_16380 [Streptomyces hebeiensis]|uniref:C2H2-type domain-containing protein n=1 Tax=Streptomyces hebeiensis TaxID=229486 RepID=A0ABN1UNT2_9ACTN